MPRAILSVARLEALLLCFIPVQAFAHGVTAGDKGYIQ